MDLRTIVAQYITHAANEVDAKGNRRAGPTMSAYRRALEGLVAACEQHCGGDLTKMPERFVENEWMGTQQSVVDKPIQLRVRVGALKQFTAWCYRNNIPCAPLAFPSIKTPPAKPKPKKEVPVSDVTMLGDYMQADPVPTTAPNVVPLAPQMPVEPTPIPRVQAAPPAVKTAPKPVGSGRPANPLAAMLPSGQYKLRVRREREMDDPVWVADFPAERVAAHGALEPFLGREVAPRLAVQGLAGDVTFLVCAVGPNGAEGERARITVAIPSAQPVASTPSVVTGAPMASPAPGLGADLTDVLAYHRKAQEELEERLAKRIEQTQKPAPTPVQENRVQNNDLDSLKQMISTLAGSMQSLASRVDDIASRPSRASMDDFMSAPPPPPPAPQLDILAVLKAVNEMGASRQPVAPPPPQMGMMEMVNMFAQMKQAFAPQNVQIDVSPLEERIDAMQAKLDAAAKKKGEISEMVENVKAMKDLMGLMGMGGEKKDAGGLGGALGNLVDKIVNDPEPIAMAVERVLGATAQLKSAQAGRPVQAAAPQPRDPLPPELRATTDALITANGDAAIVSAGYEWITMLGQIPQTKKLADRLTTLLREGKMNELTIYLKQILTHFGYGQRVPVTRITTIANALIEQVQRANASEEGDEEGEESDEEGDETPDMTVTVGGTAGEYVEQEQEQEQEEEEEDDDGEAQDDGDEQVEEEQPQDEAVMTDSEGVEHIEAPVAAAPAPKKRGRPAKAKKEAPKRKRRTPQEMAAWRAAKEEAKRLREEAKAAREAAKAARERAAAAAHGEPVAV